MTAYQVSQLQLVVLLVVVAVLPLGFLAVARRKVAAPVVAFGVLVGALDAGGFALGYLGSEGVLTPTLQVLVNYLKDAPTGLIIVYVSLVQVRRYRAARSGDRLRGWFERAPYVVGLAFAVGLAAELFVGPPVLESEKGLPAVAFFFESARYVACATYAALASYVFFGAAREEPGLLSINQRLQNLFGGIALAGLAVLPLHTLVWRAIRAFLPEERLAPLVDSLSTQEVVLVGLVAGSISACLFCHFRQGRSSEFADRFLVFLDLVGDLAEELANVPVSKGRLALPYVCMHEAAGEDILGFSSEDEQRLDAAFRARVVFEQKAGDIGGREVRISQDRLVHLAKLYDDELESRVLSAGLEGLVCDDDLPDTLEELLSADPGRGYAVRRGGLREALTLVPRAEDQGGKTTGPVPSEEWEQLVLLALADAGLLPRRQEKDVLCGRIVSRKVLDAYDLAKYKVHNHGESTTVHRPKPRTRPRFFRGEEAT